MLAKIIGRKKKKVDLGDDGTAFISTEKPRHEDAGPSGEVKRNVSKTKDAVSPSSSRPDSIQREVELPQSDVGSAESSQHASGLLEAAVEVDFELEEFRKKKSENAKLAYVYAVCRSRGIKFPPLRRGCSKDDDKCDVFMNEGVRILFAAKKLREKTSNWSLTSKTEYNNKLEKSLFWLTEAVAHAPLDSAKLAEAFCYRAQLLIELGDFIDAFVDLYRCDGPYTSNLIRTKVELLKVKCHQPLRDEEERRRFTAAADEEVASAHIEVQAEAGSSRYTWSPARTGSPAFTGAVAHVKQLAYMGALKVVNRVLPGRSSRASTSPCTSTRDSETMTPDGGPNEIDIAYKDIDEDEDVTEDEDNDSDKDKDDAPLSRNSYNSWGNVDFMAKDWEHDTNKSYLSATENIATGDWLMSARAYASILDEKYFKTHCSNCTLKSRNLFPCHNCSLVMYCCNRCRKSAWARYHKIECQYLSHMVSANRSRDEMLALRVLMVLTKQGDQLYTVTTNKPYPFTRTGFKQMAMAMGSDSKTIHKILIPFHEINAQMQYDRYKATLYLLQMLKQTAYFKYVKDEVPAYSPKLLGEEMTNREVIAALLLYKCLWVARFSSHPIIGSEKRVSGESILLTPSRQVRVGDAVYPILTWNVLKHSCKPNVTIVNFKNGSHLYASKPIERERAVRHIDTMIYKTPELGPSSHCMFSIWIQQLTYSFGGSFVDTDRKARTNRIKDRYDKTNDWFCQCKACKYDWTFESELPKYFPKYQPVKILDSNNYIRLRLLKIFFREVWRQYEKGEIVFETDMKIVYKFSDLLNKYVKEEFRDNARCQILIERHLNMKMNKKLINFLEEMENKKVFELVPE